MADENFQLDAILHCLIECSEKAAKIAQIFRDDDDFHSLVEEKLEDEKNERFVQDFKTLADVLIQETVKRDVGLKFPAIISKIQGEELNKFQNTQGKSIKVELTDLSKDTTNLLRQVLKQVTAELLASTVHSDIECDKPYSSSCVIPANRIGIWIDPIDSTGEYIKATTTETEEHGIYQNGLKCVCVLIGLFDLPTGDPVIGIINQPFHSEGTGISKWQSNAYWAIKYASERETSETLKTDSEENQKVILMSISEDPEMQKIMQSNYTVVYAAGAGYKCLQVACKKADFYIFSKGTTYFWDTCAPHAILSAQGGGILNFQNAINATITCEDDLQTYQIKYFLGTERNNIELYRNKGGILAYRDPNDAITCLHLLKKKGYQLPEDEN